MASPLGAIDNRPEFIPCDLAAVSLGGVPFSIYQTSSPEQIAFVTGDAGAKIVLVETAYLDRFKEAAAELPDVEHVVVVDGDGGTTTLEALESADPDFDPAEHAEVGLDDLLTLIYTSGTTGDPKGVLYHHRGAYLNALGNAVAFGLTPRSVYLWTLPMFHCSGWTYTWAVSVVGGTHVCPDPPPLAGLGGRVVDLEDPGRRHRGQPVGAAVVARTQQQHLFDAGGERFANQVVDEPCPDHRRGAGAGGEPGVDVALDPPADSRYPGQPRQHPVPGREELGRVGVVEHLVAPAGRLQRAEQRHVAGGPTGRVLHASHVNERTSTFLWRERVVAADLGRWPPPGVVANVQDRGIGA